jgi:hypothetical protein
MSAGISRVHGYAVLPSQRPSHIDFYTITVGANIVSESTVVNGAFDQIFRTAVDQFATVAMIGTPVYSSPNTTINFAIESTGVDALSPTGLGLGSSEGNSYGSTQAALQAAIRALGNAVGPNSIDLTGATVATFAL